MRGGGGGNISGGADRLECKEVGHQPRGTFFSEQFSAGNLRRQQPQVAFGRSVSWRSQIRPSLGGPCVIGRNRTEAPTESEHAALLTSYEIVAGGSARAAHTGGPHARGLVHASGTVNMSGCTSTENVEGTKMY